MGPEIGTLRKPFVKQSGVKSYQWTTSLACKLYSSFPFGKRTGSHLEEYIEPEIVVLGIWLAELPTTSTFIPSNRMCKMALLKIAKWTLSTCPLRVVEVDK